MGGGRPGTRSIRNSVLYLRLAARAFFLSQDRSLSRTLVPLCICLLRTRTRLSQGLIRLTDQRSPDVSLPTYRAGAHRSSIASRGMRQGVCRSFEEFLCLKKKNINLTFLML